MLLRTRALSVLFAAACAAAAADDPALLKRAQTTFKPIPATPPRLEGNPGTPEKVELGKMLYFDPRLSASWLISCNTCHNVGLGGVDLLETSIGHGWQKGPRNGPTVLNAVMPGLIRSCSQPASTNTGHTRSSRTGAAIRTPRLERGAHCFEAKPTA